MTDNQNNYDPNNPYGQPGESAADAPAAGGYGTDAAASGTAAADGASTTASTSGDYSSAGNYGGSAGAYGSSYDAGQGTGADGQVAAGQSAPGGYGAQSAAGGYGAPGNYPVVKEDPGKVLGIVALVASLSTFIGFGIIGPIVGIICGKMSRTKSREAGFEDNVLGKWGFILGIILLILGVLALIAVIILSVIAASTAPTTTY